MEIQSQGTEGRHTSIVSRALDTIMRLWKNGGSAYHPNKANEKRALYVRHTPTPISSSQFLRLQTCDSVLLDHQLSIAKPMVQSRRSAAFRPRLRTGDRPWRKCNMMVTVRERIVRRETRRSYSKNQYSRYVHAFSPAHVQLSTYQDKCPRQPVVLMVQLPQEIRHYPRNNDRRDQLRASQDMEGKEGVGGRLRPTFVAERHLELPRSSPPKDVTRCQESFPLDFSSQSGSQIWCPRSVKRVKRVL
jgi:hypothetical protein